jgi:3-oxoacyl-[acyl-carrier-protein] synthase II
MAASSRRVVLTGIGVVNAIGKDPAGFWQGLVAGRSGIRTIGAFDTSGLPVHIAGEVPDFDARNFVEKKERKGLRVMARTIQFAVAAAQVALADSRVNKEQLDPTRFGCDFGSSMLATEVEDVGEAARVSGNCRPGVVDLEKWGEQGIETIEPLWMLKYLPNMQACHVSILHNAQGPNNTITENEAAGLLALGEASRIIRRDEADFMLVGGAESRLSPLSLVRMCLFEPLSRCADPARACRPFDRRRDGAVLGEGGGVVVLEELEHARRRGAHIYAELVGFGAAFQGRGTDRAHDAGGIVRAIRQALARAGVGPEEIDHVNAQGFSTVAGDRWEARAIAEVFGSCSPPVPVVAYKSYFGNLGAGSGTTELAASLLALEHGLLPGTLNYEEPDPECPVAVVGGSPRLPARKHFLKINFTHVGQCVAVVCRKWE